MPRNARKSRHKALLKEIAAPINQPADSLAVKLVSLARLKLDAVEAQLLAGDSSVTVGDIESLRGVFDQYVPKPKIEVTLEYVDGTGTAAPDAPAVDGLVECRRCHWRPFDKDRAWHMQLPSIAARSDLGSCRP